MRRMIILAAVIGVGLCAAAAPARAGVVADLLAVLGLGPAPSSPAGPVSDAQNCDTGECE